MSESNTMPGGWTPFRCDISKEENDIFRKATERLLGVEYSSVAVSTQVVSGINYRFLCNAKAVYPDAPDYSAMVCIYAPLDGEPHITEIKRIDA